MAKEKKVIINMGLPAWMGTYGDLVTLLLCFFVLLFASSSVDASKFQAIAASFNDQTVLIQGGSSNNQGELLGSGIMQLPNVDRSIHDSKENYKKQQEELSNMASDFKTYFAENDLSENVSVELGENYVKLNFKDGILFDSGQDELTESSKDILLDVVTQLQEYENSEIIIEGHTDNIPISTEKIPSNWYLSSHRALAVLTFFIENGLLPEMLNAHGRGEHSPIADNSTLEGRAQNRRVEIKIMSSYSNE